MKRTLYLMSFFSCVLLIFYWAMSTAVHSQDTENPRHRLCQSRPDERLRRERWSLSRR